MHNPKLIPGILPIQNSCTNGNTIHIVVVTINNYSHEISGITPSSVNHTNGHCDIVSWISRRMLYAATLHHALYLLNQGVARTFSPTLELIHYGLVLMALAVLCHPPYIVEEEGL